jgi:hypothetical protein
VRHGPIQRWRDGGWGRPLTIFGSGSEMSNMDYLHLPPISAGPAMRGHGRGEDPELPARAVDQQISIRMRNVVEVESRSNRVPLLHRLEVVSEGWSPIVPGYASKLLLQHHAKRVFLL